MTSPKILGVIPARGGSKGVPRKNLRLLGGVPLVVHTIRQALSAHSISRVLVSTDDQEIMDCSASAGAEVSLRPPELAADTASTDLVLIHVLDSLYAADGYQPDLIALLQPTSPLRCGEDIDKSVEHLLVNGGDSLLSVCRSHSFLWHYTPNGPSAINYDFRKRPMRQDVEQFRENGAIYLTRTALLRRTENRLGGRIILFEMPSTHSVEFDSEDDWRVIEYLYGHQGNQ